jgi:hypothetical protein
MHWHYSTYLHSGVVFESLTWLPDWPETRNPNLLQSILTVSSPETFLSPGNFGHLKGGNKRTHGFRINWEFFKIKLRGLFKVSDCFLNSCPLAGSSNLGTFSDKHFFFPVDDGCEGLHIIQSSLDRHSY